MKTIKILQTNSKSIKKIMTMSGVEGVRVRQYGKGIVVYVKDTSINIEKTLNFFNTYDLRRSNGDAVKSTVSKCLGVADFGNLFRVEVL